MPTSTAACPPTSGWVPRRRGARLTVTVRLFHRHPDRAEGDLAKLRASVVNTCQALAEVARGLADGGLGEYLLLGRGELNSGGTGKASILADGLEALLGRST